MEIVNFGHFKLTSTTGIQFFTNEDGQDWYDLRRGLTTWDEQGNFLTAIYGAWAMVDPVSLRVTNVEQDPSRMVPNDKIVLGIDADHEAISEGMIYQNGALQAAPVEPIPEPVTVVYSVDLWERMTDEQAEQVRDAMALQPFRTQKIFEAAGSYRSDHSLWPLLKQIATELFGAETASAILAPST
ncbi:hypothetical protein [Agrobacterium sp. CFBP2214]|uniref:hypothetical protein n=1 Tax=Agrobacterium sp. CFBP2214 TaxID=3040274 RepID=UPI00254E8C18|nr:hypothetical protein [Agrobacterium sp. CFBP2214]